MKYLESDLALKSDAESLKLESLEPVAYGETFDVKFPTDAANEPIDYHRFEPENNCVGQLVVTRGDFRTLQSNAVDFTREGDTLPA